MAPWASYISAGRKAPPTPGVCAADQGVILSDSVIGVIGLFVFWACLGGDHGPVRASVDLRKMKRGRGAAPHLPFSCVLSKDPTQLLLGTRPISERACAAIVRGGAGGQIIKAKGDKGDRVVFFSDIQSRHGRKAW